MEEISEIQVQNIEDQNTESLDPYSPTETDIPWIDWHVSVPGNQFLVSIEKGYINNSVNMLEFKDNEYMGF